jgi:hypothetical protein
LTDEDGYQRVIVGRDAPFDELRRRSLINEAAQAADDAPDFSERCLLSK